MWNDWIEFASFPSFSGGRWHPFPKVAKHLVKLFLIVLWVSNNIRTKISLEHFIKRYQVGLWIWWLSEAFSNVLKEANFFLYMMEYYSAIKY